VFPSYLWIATHAAANIVGGFVVLERIAARQVAASALAGVGVLGTAYLMRTDGGWGAMALMLLIGWLILR
jgi:hypothetical protein